MNGADGICKYCYYGGFSWQVGGMIMQLLAATNSRGQHACVACAYASQLSLSQQHYCLPGCMQTHRGIAMPVELANRCICRTGLSVGVWALIIGCGMMLMRVVVASGCCLCYHCVPVLQVVWLASVWLWVRPRCLHLLGGLGCMLGCVGGGVGSTQLVVLPLTYIFCLGARSCDGNLLSSLC